METTVAVEVQKQNRKTRRRGQSGSIFKRGDFWTIIYRMRERTPEDKQKQKWEGGFRTKEAAKTRLDEVLGAIRANKYVEPTDMLFGTFCDNWMENGKATLKPTTWAFYRSVLKTWIRPAFGDRPVCEISRSEVKDFLFALLRRPEITRACIRNIHRILHLLFEDAVEREVVFANPAHKIKLPAAEESQRVIPTTEEVVLTFAKLRPSLQALLITGAMTGARRSELTGLHWGDIDWAEQIIRIRRSLHRVPRGILDGGEFRNVERIGNSGLVLTPPKSKKGNRDVEIPSHLVAILSSLRPMQASPGDFVFQSELGGPIDPDGLDTLLHRAQDEAGVRHFGLHGLRHLYASLLHKSGATVKFAQERLGHADASTTLDIYTHLVGNGDEGRAAAKSVAAAFNFPYVSLTLANPALPAGRVERVN